MAGVLAVTRACARHSCSCLFRASKPFLPYLASLAGAEGRNPADVIRSHPPADFSVEPDTGTYDEEDMYSDYDDMPATFDTTSGNVAAPVAHSSLQSGQTVADPKNAGTDTGRTRAKRKIT